MSEVISMKCQACRGRGIEETRSSLPNAIQPISHSPCALCNGSGRYETVLLSDEDFEGLVKEALELTSEQE